MNDLLTRLAWRAVGSVVQVRPRARPAFADSDAAAAQPAPGLAPSMATAPASAATPFDTSASAPPDASAAVPRNRLLGGPLPQRASSRGDSAARVQRQRGAPGAVTADSASADAPCIATQDEPAAPRNASEHGALAAAIDRGTTDAVTVMATTPSVAPPDRALAMERTHDTNAYAIDEDGTDAADTASPDRRADSNEARRAAAQLARTAPAVAAVTTGMWETIRPPTAVGEPGSAADEAATHTIATRIGDARPFDEPRGGVHRSSATWPALTEPQLEAPAEPVVRVTIGRVEIRAMVPAAPATPRPTGREPRTLSLADYLSSRNGASP